MPTRISPGPAAGCTSPTPERTAADVLDCRSGAYLRALPDLPGVAGILIDTAADLLFHSSRRIAEQHHGRRWLESTSGLGSLSVLALPLARPAPAGA